MNKFERFNKPHTPTAEAQDFIYKLYWLLFQTPVSLRTKQTTLETAAVNLYSWKIVCISRKALQSVIRTKSAEGLRRGHPLKRAERAKKLFEITKPMNQSEFISYYFQHDTVALVISEENNKHGTDHWSELYDVPEGRLVSGSFSVRLGPGDLAWAETLCQQEGISAA